MACAWSRKIVRITFPHFELESSSNCNYDFLQIHDGESASSHLIGTYCGTNVPAELFSSHNSLYFLVPLRRHRQRGRLHCGLAGPATSVWRNPNRPFAFGTLSMEHHDNCNYDFLEIRDGLLGEDPVLGKFCSTGSPAPVQTTGPTAWVHFHSDYSVSDRGFHITFTTSPSDPGCGGTYTESEGTIISPNWPNNYAHNRQCIYIIRLPPSEVVSLNFTNMQLESHSGCAFDYVEVRDGMTETSALIGKYCGYTVPAPITSSSNTLWIRFKSDGSVSQAGFRAEYQVGCGGILSGSGQIRSPYHPNSYPHDKTCEWVINQPPGYVVTLSFLTFDIETSSNCRYDHVEVRDGSTVNSPLIGRYCGNQEPDLVQSTQRSMFIRFKTDASVTNHGFTAQYESAEEGCGETLNDPSGTITSPGHPTNYPHGANCTWFISVAPGNIIRLSFTSFNLEFHHECRYDYVEVFDNGTAQTGTSLGRYCGRSVPPSLTSTDNLLTVLFVSDASLATEGFSANYVTMNATTDCSEVFTSPTGVLSSPNYPQNYPINRQCIYRIIVGVNMQIMLNFTDFYLEGNACSYDYLELRDGGYETSPLIGKYCSGQGPPLVVSHSNRLWIKFRSDYSVTFRGFTAHWDGTQTGCGGTLTTSTGSFSSPNYPLPYHPNAECYWHIKANGGSRVQLQFGDFHLEASSSCSYDYLAVYDGNSTNAPVLAKLCGTATPPVISSTRGQMYVKLRTDRTIGAGGFLATYTQSCQGIVIANQSRGLIESPNYPNSYPHYANCSWTITATMGNTINYTFQAFNLEQHSLCRYDYVKIGQCLRLAANFRFKTPALEKSQIRARCGGRAPLSLLLPVMFRLGASG
ncbi:hypothetical protein SKAU_G00367290 [Synaphobranchus kaupii]|uniref:CUB domain-containing protein n=1 Tax=Synaphobranchus kaupii TaxID=118154 RepID=A0A9Q1EFB7_SYNKA|nr:hypothetical protein SKAU_G00367290 [Synaphobranchus kaupii]